MEEKKTVDILKEKLFTKRENGWKSKNSDERNVIFEHAKGYISYMNKSKTEREIVSTSVQLAEKEGFRDINEFSTLKPGDRIYYVNREKSMYLAIIGENNIEEGVNIIGAHADSPRLDLKPNPLYEDNEFAYLKTHYYGGIKKISMDNNSTFNTWSYS